MEKHKRIKMTRIVNLMCVLLCATTISYSQEDFHLVINRKFQHDNCVMGVLTVEEEVLGYTIEVPWPDDNKDSSCIPPGTYNGIIHYDKVNCWVIELDSVPGRTGVQIHMGDYARDVPGCILVGANGAIEACILVNSGLVHRRLRRVFYEIPAPESTPDRKIRITFQ